MEKKRNRKCVSLIFALPVCLLGLSPMQLGATETSSQTQEHLKLSESSTETTTQRDSNTSYQLIDTDELLAYNDGDCYDPCCPCPVDECCETVEFVDYLPSEEGIDPGLHCLPGSTCNFSCPTKPSGAKVFRTQGRLSHRLRYGSFYTPEQWRTIMLHMRTLLPMTACDYRKVLHFLQEKPYQRRANPCCVVPSNPEGASSTDMAAADSLPKEGELLAEGDGASDGSEEVVVEEEASLEELVGPIEGGSFDFSGGAFSGSHWVPRFNTIFCGYILFDYAVPFQSFFGDMNGQRSFFYYCAPYWMTSYGESIFSIVKLFMFNFGQDGYAVPVTASVAYFYNDYLTLQFGLMVLPFGNYWTHHFNQTDKCGSSPLFRTGFTKYMIVPNKGVGVGLQGAIPLCCLGSWFNRASFNYNLYAINGPSEFLGADPFVDFPPGSIYMGEMAPNNNNDTTFGGRLGINPTDCAIFGVSYMRGRWNSDAISFGTDPNNHLYYQAAAFDWTINFNPYIQFCGEVIWTQYENNHNPNLPMAPYPWVRRNGYWSWISCNLGILRCWCPSIYECKPCLWDSLEFVVRSGGLWQQKSGQLNNFPFGGFDYSGYYKRRLTFCLGYYFTETFSMKLNYDINYGEKGNNFLRQFVTGSTKKSGFAKNVFTLRFVYGW